LLHLDVLRHKANDEERIEDREGRFVHRRSARPHNE
jgi:hypothetical protein